MSSMAVLGWDWFFVPIPGTTKILLPVTWPQQHWGWCPELVLCHCDTPIIFLHSSKMKQIKITITKQKQLVMLGREIK